MEIQITKPTKAVNWKQLAEEAEVTLGGIRTKGDRMWLMDISQKDVDKVVNALKTHTSQKKIKPNPIIEKLDLILEKLNGTI